MCLLVIAHKVHPRYPLLLAANRDEFHARPTAPLEAWAHPPGVVAGRDLQGGGTWLAMDRGGRLAAVTNYREPGLRIPEAVSRGGLVTGYLTGDRPPEDYLGRLAPEAGRYNGFNLVVGGVDRLCYFSNRAPGIRTLPPGIHALSNHLLATPWPKVVKVREAFAGLLAPAGEIPSAALMAILQDATPAPDADLPDTGVGPEWERRLSAIFIRSPAYGTRSTSVIRVDREGRADFTEWTHPPDAGAPAPPPLSLSWRIEPPPGG